MNANQLPISAATVRRLTARPGTALTPDEIGRLERAGWLTPDEVRFLTQTANKSASNFARRKSLTKKQLDFRTRLNVRVRTRAVREAGRDD
jgi:hypothetical protein